MQANNAKNRKTSTASNGSGSIPKNNGGAKVRHGSGGATAQGMADLQDRFQIVLWRRPLQTIHYFFREIPCAVNDAGKRFIFSLYDSKKRTIPLSRKIVLFMTIAAILYGLHFIFGRDEPQSIKARENVYWYGYWIILGILSSVGLGTGLHTFVLYLGPFIAKVALAADECGTLDFPKPPYPDQVMCPEDPDFTRGIVSVYDIICKVRWESLMWGFGTALGELPPFFMARAARVSGMVDDEDLEKFAELLQRKKRGDPKSLSIIERGKLFMEDLVEKVGFWGILACASIPNPLFDLAGITCGHFLVPFTTFFGATVIGKAIIKAHLQMAFVILAFNQDLLDRVVTLIRTVPQYGSQISDPFVEYISHQKANLHNKTNASGEPGHIAYVLDKVVMLVVIYFVISIVNSMAQAYHKRICREKVKHKS
ncbi:vacuole membrane protein 1 isoform X2 [Folsomia candida]|nr:vacuole membrane protein 1 isoform X2 [Folsomia candida]XP_035702630.1 vacuole membrane protein 1 isoform X2 [Folsomia candida]XP_035702631.1 vacuole membrane protein 1 isoform X2 [Folsomia candida]